MNRITKRAFATLATVLGASALSLAISSTAHAQNIGSTISEGQSILPGQWMASPSGEYILAFQGDGNLVFRTTTPPINVPWASNTNGTVPVRVSLQSDGNFALYDTQGSPWSTRTNGWLAVTVSVGDDGHFRVDGSLPYWATGPAQSAAPLRKWTGHAATLKEGVWLQANQYLESENGEFVLYMQGDGNLVLSQNNVGIWATHTNGTSAVIAVVEDSSNGFGDLVLRDARNNVVWSAHANSHSVARNYPEASIGSSLLSVQDDGNLVLYTSMELTYPVLPQVIH